MAEYKGFQIPEDLYYELDHHVWARVENGQVVVGATDPAQASAGSIIHLSVKKVGTQLRKGAIMATVESAKYMGPMRAPVAGTLVEVNQEVVKQPTLVNGDAYANWVAKIQPDNLDADLAQLVPGAAAVERYPAIIDAWEITKS